MPRAARLDIPGVLQHIMARGIEKREIYRDRRDRQAFLERLSDIVVEGQARLYAWALMPNHFHLLLRPQVASMVDIMRRLMTGYSVWHNRRHKRSGHLFQNRYKSIVVEEEPYFLELVRYIHLNPIRGNLLTELVQLDTNPYTGHAVIMGKHRYACQDVDWALSWFGNQVGKARRKYRAFVKAGFQQGVREELRGGGLIRSMGGREKFAACPKQERGTGDERILGDGTFVECTLKKCERRQPRKKASVERILVDVCRSKKISRELILSSCRVRSVCRARRIFLLRAYEEAGASYARLGRLCGFAHTSVMQAIEKARIESETGNN